MTKPSMIERRLTVAEVAEIARLSVHAVLRFIRDGQLRAINYSRRSGRPTWRIHPDDLRAFEARRSSTLGKEPVKPRPKAVKGFKRYV